ncbi:MAG: hypothetical protein E7255_16230 [Lachnospiraceae bacterium]|jgi:thiamine transporter ThiT|nr:hypothetical protein [Lachnospiraceae bacterium]
MGARIGVFTGSSICKYWDFKTHSDLYVMQIAPWYLSIEIQALFTLISCIICIIIKCIIRKKLNIKLSHKE